MATNPFDQFDNTASNPFDQFDNGSAGSQDEESFGHKALRYLDKANHLAAQAAGPAPEAVLNFGSGIPAALGSGLAYLGGLATGDPNAALAVKQGTEEKINDKLQYQSQSEMGKKATELLNKGMQKVIEAGGPAFENTIKSIPFVGKDLADNHEAMDAIGKAYTEMALNMTPIHEIGGLLKRGAETKATPHAADILDNLEKKPAAVNPFDQFDDNGQGQLNFGDTDKINANMEVERLQKELEDQQARQYELQRQTQQELHEKAKAEMAALNSDYADMEAKDSGQMSLLHNDNVDALPYKKEFPFDLEPMEKQPTETQMGLNMEETDPTMETAQREAIGARELQATPGRNFFLDPNNREKLIRPEDREPSAMREFFLDPKNMDKVDFHDNHNFANEALGDKTLMDHVSTGAMVDSLRSGDVNSALDTIVQNHDNVAYRNLADYLKGKLDGLNIKVHDEGILTLGDRQATGYYDPTTRTVGFSGVGAVSPHTVLHELVHAMTSDFMNSRPNDLRVMGLKDLYNKLNDLGMQKEFPQIVNVKEFLAEAFSNPEFQDFLKEHRIQNRSMWRRFVDNVKSVIGLSNSVRNHVTDALDHVLDLGKQVMDANAEAGRSAPLKDAGLPSDLADLMVTRKKRPEPVNTKNAEDVQRLKVPGLTGPISDFTFYDKPISEIVEMAKQADDIPNTMLENLSHQLQAGGLFESLKTRNPVVKQTFERLWRATQEAESNIKETMTDPHTGLVPLMRELNPVEKGEVWAVAMKYEGDRVLSGQELRQAGLNERQVAYYLKERELNERMFKEINEARANIGLRPMDHRVAHIAGRFTGDFSRFVFNADGKIVGRIAGRTKWELDRISKFIAEKHPDFQMGKRDYNTLGRSKKPADRFTGLMEAVNFLTKTDSDAAALFESYRDYMQRDAVNYLNATRSAKAKVRESGGIIGSEGHKEWESLEKNAEEGMKAQIAYFEQSFKWIAMEKAVNDLKPLLGNEEVIKQTPNAVEWAEQYKAHALGRIDSPIANAGNWAISKIGEWTGVGHSNIFKYTNLVKHFTMQKFMGFMNIPFSLTQMMQPLQVHPAMIALLKNRGLEFSARSAMVKAVNTYFNALTGQKLGKLSAFEKAAMDYADKMGIIDVKMADHTKDINQSKFWDKYHQMADFNIEIPERLTRGSSFLFYAHILKDAGIPAKDIFGAAENMTNMTMVNYHPIERPMGYAKLGWLGDLASTLTRYKHNQVSQMAFYTREGVMHGNYTPMASFLATSIAFGGVLGFFGFNEADEAYQWITKYLGHPDSLTAEVLGSGMPEVLSHGVFSTLGMDMTTRFSNANLLPNSAGQGLIPFGSAVLDMAEATGRFITDPSEYTGKQMLKSFAPQSLQGPIENAWFTEKQSDGSNLYQNSTDGPNLGKGRVYRSDGEMAMRDFGFRSIRESKELAKNYAKSQVEAGNKEIADKLVMSAKYAALNGSLNQAKFAEFVNKATKYGMSPNQFVGEMVSWQRDRHLSQDQQQRLRDAMGGFRGAVNISQGR